jgi:hypothetical protein
MIVLPNGFFISEKHHMISFSYLSRIQLTRIASRKNNDVIINNK